MAKLRSTRTNTSTKRRKSDRRVVSERAKMAVTMAQHHGRDMQEVKQRAAAHQAANLTTPFRPMKLLGMNPAQRVCWSKDAPFAPFMHTTLHTRQTRHLVNRQGQTAPYLGSAEAQKADVYPQVMYDTGDIEFSAPGVAAVTDGFVRGCFIPAVPRATGAVASFQTEKLGVGTLPMFERFAGLGYAYYTVTASRIKVRLKNDLVPYTPNPIAPGGVSAGVGTPYVQLNGPTTKTGLDQDAWAHYNQYQAKRRLYLHLNTNERATYPANEENGETPSVSLQVGIAKDFDPNSGATTIPTSNWRSRGRGPLHKRRFLEENLRHIEIDDINQRDAVLEGHWSLEGHYGHTFADIWQHSFDTLVQENQTGNNQDFEFSRDKTFTGIISNNLYNELSTQNPTISWGTGTTTNMGGTAAGWNVFIDTDDSHDYTRANGHDVLDIDVEYDIVFWGMPPKAEARITAVDPA